MATKSLSIASLNAAGHRDLEKLLRNIEAIEQEGRVDVLLLQEAEHSICGEPHSVRAIAGRLGMCVVYAAEEIVTPNKVSALATFSRYPIVVSCRIELPRFGRLFNNQARIALMATIDSPLGPITTCNVHLDTRINASQQLQQLYSVARAAENIGGPQIVAGDFNCTDLFWIGHVIPLPFVERQTQNIVRMMSSYGFSTPFTSTGPTSATLPFKLDWTFLRGLRAISPKIIKVPHSDHRALFLQADLAP